jgi:dihydrofolate reductase
LVTFNSSVNVFIYIIFGEKFQKQFLQWIKRYIISQTEVARNKERTPEQVRGRQTNREIKRGVVFFVCLKLLKIRSD